MFNGKQLRVWTTKYAANESIMITKSIDAKEVRYVMGVYLTNTFTFKNDPPRKGRESNYEN